MLTSCDELSFQELDSNSNESIISFFDNSPSLYNHQIICDDDFSSFEKTGENILRSGRKRQLPLAKGEKIHDKKSPDNTRRKIHVHYFLFIKKVANELLNYFGFRDPFIDIDYQEKRNLTKTKFLLLKKSNIGQILCQKVSSKFRRKSKENLFKNNAIFNQVKGNKYINYFLSQNYITLFQNVYLKNKRDINIYDLNFQFSEKVETFGDFLKKLEKYDDKDEYESKINEVIHKNYSMNYFKVEKI
jgi:hypothetical protein